MTATDTYVPRLKTRYYEEIRAQLKEQLGLTNIMQVPTFEKVVVNMGIGEAITDAKVVDGAARDLETITGQRPARTVARKSIAGFRLRAGMPVGMRVTLRGDRMWDFLDRLMSVALPRIRDFRGLPATSFDGHGNYTFGVTEQLIFPEVDYDDIDAVRGMDIVIVTSATEDTAGRALLAAYGWPFTDMPQGA